MQWSLVQECLATADFSSSAFSQLVLRSLRRNERFLSLLCEINFSFCLAHTRWLIRTTELYYTLERVLNLFLLDHGVREKADVI